ncbi:hypothetical protein SARC_02669 [Sphaeroforma arctica JP610]|uniref:Uncharacterized protein n=1 Tax=Sphaeroforma arctica JP610 TaxID=667725 RepID=A0A0L0G827_9EUKA|nr:hypothetical protein SARC_02669 [Sphaeroforma arctica JP610]KNC85145.1 hypothetical protein SARC_02669 [Sphaeroforma arctica JP610]|eukprot:XP_014159047.1 hypothetical protein SARC_02669 [Sphaeroforma arctica JP610]
MAEYSYASDNNTLELFGKMSDPCLEFGATSAPSSMQVDPVLASQGRKRTVETSDSAVAGNSDSSAIFSDTSVGSITEKEDDRKKKKTSKRKS